MGYIKIAGYLIWRSLIMMPCCNVGCDLHADLGGGETLAKRVIYLEAHVDLGVKRPWLSLFSIRGACRPRRWRLCLCVFSITGSINEIHETDRANINFYKVITTFYVIDMPLLLKTHLIQIRIRRT